MTNPARAARRRRIERRILLSSDWICRAAAGRTVDPEERWMLGQPRAVRRSYVAQVLERAGDQELLRQVWMLRQADPVRQSYVREVLEPRAASLPRS